MPLSRSQVLLLVPLVIGLLLRLRLVGNDAGIFWPDEIYQSFEPAHALVFGHGLIPWEFIEGARNWALPGLIAFVMKVCAMIGADQPTEYIPAVKGLFVVMSVGTTWGTYRLAKSVGAAEFPAAASAAIFSLAGPVLYFAPRAMSENATALPLIWGLSCVLDRAQVDEAFGPSPSVRARRLLWFGSSLLGLAVLFRLQSAVVCVGVGGVLVARRQWKALRDVGVVLALWALLFGALDALTWSDAPGAKWGGWFHSAIVYLRFNLIEGKAAGWGVAPWYFFAHRLWTSMPFITVLLVGGLVLSLRRAPALIALVLLFFVLHSASPHKEYRFILPMLPMLVALVAVGVTWLSIERHRKVAALVVVVASVHSAATHESLTFGQLGQYPGRENESAWDDNGPINRLMLIASAQADLCGLFTPVHPAWMGGSTYLHRKAPLFSPGWPYDCVEAGTCNYAILAKGSPLRAVAEDKMFALVKIHDRPCRPDPNYAWRLP
jgi:GPI mannosyltransferase 3